MFLSNDTQRGSFIEQLREAREEREAERLKEVAVIKIQSSVRGWMARNNYQNSIRKQFDSHFGPESVSNVNKDKILPVASEVFKDACKLMKIYRRVKDASRLECYTRYLLISMESNDRKLSYVSCAIDKDLTLHWIQHIKEVTVLVCQELQKMQVELSSDNRLISLYLHLLLTFTATSTWRLLQQQRYEPLRPALKKLTQNIQGELVAKGMHLSLQQILIKGLCRSKSALSGPAIVTIITLCIRPLSLPDQHCTTVHLLTIYFLNVPALIHHISVEANNGLNILLKNQIFEKVINYVYEESNLKTVFNELKGCYALCLLANLIHLASLQHDVLQPLLYHPKFSTVVYRILASCGEYVTTNQCSLTQWHPLLGWFSKSLDHHLNESVDLIRSQLQLLWTEPILKIMFQPLHNLLNKASEMPRKESFQGTAPPGRTKTFIKKTLESGFSSVMGMNKDSYANSSKYTKSPFTFDDPEVVKLFSICSMYYMAMTTLSQLKMDILTGICHKNDILCGLWMTLSSFGFQSGLKSFLHQISVRPNASAQVHFLVLFCEGAIRLISVLDDLEMYEMQQPFTLQDYRDMSLFLNNLTYKMIKNRLVNLDDLAGSALFYSCHTLLKLLYKRNSRRSFVSDSHWYISEVNGSSLMIDMEKGKKVAEVLIQSIPHILPHHDRVLLFRNFVKADKNNLTQFDAMDTLIPSTLITVRRGAIVEDGYRQLASLSPNALKGIIRVRFVNQQGLDEAGIDQDGVFKEFLEETLKRIFDPSLNLFRLTSEERLFPSPISSMTENHLQLFEFTGKMLGKAVYEGILVDFPFALFFLSQVIGEQQTALYSFIDELPSLDPELYKNLTYIKHYEGDVSDLGLTFSHDEDYLGEVVNHELRPGGKGLSVTNENRISYIHLMAHFKLHTQIKDQTRAFVKGFRTIISKSWMTIFSAPEFQRLISGDNVALNIQDLRQHTHYYGGFHDKHRVVSWLWDILQNDFTEEERGLFLKFVTSCSKPPLLGFSNLEPPFSIRCVEVNDDEDTGDTVGSVIRGFFAIRKDPVNRLPTSSTCFNLLKLPNYQKKSNLKEKLRYAIHSNTGFELS